MKTYITDDIRNVCILGHKGCGKTSLVEACAYLSGFKNKLGKISEGTTISDYDKEEIKRGFSISTSVVPIEWENIKINLLDTPGYFDFIGETEEAISASDAAVIVVSGKNGIETGTIKAWELCEKFKLPRFFFISHMDQDNVSLRKTVLELQEKFGKSIAPFYMPIRENEKFIGYINIVKELGRKFIDEGKYEECDIPEYSKANLEINRGVLLEAVAETSEEFMDRYFSGDTFSLGEIEASLKSSIIEGSITPVEMGSSSEVLNISSLLKDIVRYFPSPNNVKVNGINCKTNEIFEGNHDFNKQKTAFVFKTIIDPFIGKYSLIKVRSGIIKVGDTLYNNRKDCEVKINKLYILSGNKPIEIEELHPGDIGAMGKLNETKTGDTLSPVDLPIIYTWMDISKPYTYMRYVCENKGDEDKVSLALLKLKEEDLTLKVIHDNENRQNLIYGIGDLQLEIIVSKLKDRYKTTIKLEEPRISYKETISQSSDIDEKYKKQSGGHGQYGHVKMKFSPLGDLSKAYEFTEEVVGGSVPKNYFPAVEKGLEESIKAGPMAGYPVLGILCNLYDGSYHPVDSSEMAFKIATIGAFKKGILEAGPILLEPIELLKVIVPEKYSGDVLGDLNKKRGKVLNINSLSNSYSEIEAEIPMEGLKGYCTVLRAMTSGMGTYSYSFKRYDRAPKEVQEREVSKKNSDDN